MPKRTQVLSGEVSTAQEQHDLIVRLELIAMPFGRHEAAGGCGLGDDLRPLQ